MKTLLVLFVFIFMLLSLKIINAKEHTTNKKAEFMFSDLNKNKKTLDWNLSTF